MPSDETIPKGFSAPKREILLLLKRRGPVALTDIASALGVSKVAALRHLVALESAHLIERANRHNGVGRPRAYFELTPHSGRLFPEAYSQMSLSAMKFIEDRLGRDAVTTLLQQRAHEVQDENRSKFEAGGLGDRVRTLVQLRDDGGYMAEAGTTHHDTHELLEHNCPILTIAGRYPEACEVERRMFESLLRADVQTSHRVVAGAPVCRFLIRPRKEGE